jgi:hypothetical protein
MNKLEVIREKHREPVGEWGYFSDQADIEYLFKVIDQQAKVIEAYDDSMTVSDMEPSDETKAELVKLNELENK